MREIISQFQRYRTKFNGNFQEVRMDLPEPLDDISIPLKVVRGEMTITK
jgi:hypothetical protein